MDLNLMDGKLVQEVDNDASNSSSGKEKSASKIDLMKEVEKLKKNANIQQKILSQEEVILDLLHDCKWLLKKFIDGGDISVTAFRKLWHDTDFVYIFASKPEKQSLHLHVEEILAVAKSLWLPKDPIMEEQFKLLQIPPNPVPNMDERIAAFYLVYFLYMHQPTYFTLPDDMGPVSYYIDVSNIQSFQEFITYITAHKLTDQILMLKVLWEKNAFQFSVSNYENPILHLPLDEVVEMRSHETNITPFGDNFPKFVKHLADITCFGAAYVVAKTEIPKKIESHQINLLETPFVSFLEKLKNNGEQLRLKIAKKPVADTPTTSLVPDNCEPTSLVPDNCEPSLPNPVRSSSDSLSSAQITSILKGKRLRNKRTIVKSSKKHKSAVDEKASTSSAPGGWTENQMEQEPVAASTDQISRVNVTIEDVSTSDEVVQTETIRSQEVRDKNLETTAATMQPQKGTSRRSTAKPSYRCLAGKCSKKGHCDSCFPSKTITSTVTKQHPQSVAKLAPTSRIPPAVKRRNPKAVTEVAPEDGIPSLADIIAMSEQIYKEKNAVTAKKMAARKREPNEINFYTKKIEFCETPELQNEFQTSILSCGCQNVKCNHQTESLESAEKRFERTSQKTYKSQKEQLNELSLAAKMKSLKVATDAQRKLALIVQKKEEAFAAKAALKNKFDVYYNAKKNIAHLQLTKALHPSKLTHSLMCNYPEIGESTHLFYPNRIDPRFRGLETYLQLFSTLVNQPHALGLLTLNIGGQLVPVHSLHEIDDSLCRLIGQVTANVLPLDTSVPRNPIWSWTFNNPSDTGESANSDEPYGMLTFKRLELPQFTIKNLLTGEYLVLNKTTSEVPTQIELGSQSQLSHHTEDIESESTSQVPRHTRGIDLYSASTSLQSCPTVIIEEWNSTSQSYSRQRVKNLRSPSMQPQIYPIEVIELDSTSSSQSRPTVIIELDSTSQTQTLHYRVKNLSLPSTPSQICPTDVIEVDSTAALSQTPHAVVFELDSTSQSHHSKVTDASFHSTPSQICSTGIIEPDSTAALSQTPHIKATNLNAPSTSSQTRHTPSTISKRQKDRKMVSLLRKKAIMNCFVKKHTTTKPTKKVSAFKRKSNKKRNITVARKTNTEETYESMMEISAIMCKNEEMQQSLLARWGYGEPQDFNEHKKIRSEKVKTARQCNNAAEQKYIVETVMRGLKHNIWPSWNEKENVKVSQDNSSDSTDPIFVQAEFVAECKPTVVVLKNTAENSEYILPEPLDPNPRPEPSTSLEVTKEYPVKKEGKTCNQSNSQKSKGKVGRPRKKMHYKTKQKLMAATLENIKEELLDAAEKAVDNIEQIVQIDAECADCVIVPEVITGTP